jgi:hypothetical protein
MKHRCRRIQTSPCLSGLLFLILPAGLAALLMPAWGQQTNQPPEGRSRARASWYKGNIHAHTIATDGDSSAEDVVRWYRDQKYHFLVLSDHNTLTNIDGLNALYATGELVGADRRQDVPFNPFVLIPGEELTDRFSDATATAGERDLAGREVHLGALNIRKAIAPQGGSSIAETLQRDVAAIRAAGGVPVLNHPNFTWAITGGDMKSVKNLALFEVFNGHQQAHNLGGGSRPGVEEIWDEALSGGALFYGVATDDSHQFQRLGLPNAMSAPGRGWIMVRSERFSAQGLIDAIERGDFYATTGVELADYQATARQVSITIKPFSRSKYRVSFIGKGGRVLKDVPVDPVITARTGPLNAKAGAVTYEMRGDEGYVRAKIMESNGLAAWTQPVMVKPN